MSSTFELLPNEAELSHPLFANDEEYQDFRRTFMEEVIPLQEEWMEARRKSEQESRQRLLK